MAQLCLLGQVDVDDGFVENGRVVVQIFDFNHHFEQFEHALRCGDNLGIEQAADDFTVAHQLTVNSSFSPQVTRFRVNLEKFATFYYLELAFVEGRLELGILSNIANVRVGL